MTVLVAILRIPPRTAWRNNPRGVREGHVINGLRCSSLGLLKMRRVGVFFGMTQRHCRKGEQTCIDRVFACEVRRSRRTSWNFFFKYKKWQVSHLEQWTQMDNQSPPAMRTFQTSRTGEKSHSPDAPNQGNRITNCSISPAFSLRGLQMLPVLLRNAIEMNEFI